MVGGAGEVHLEVGPLGLQPALHPGQHARCTAGGGVHQIVVFAQPHGDTVVKHHAVFVQHQAIAAFANFELGPGVAVHPVQQNAGVRALNVDLAQGGAVERADAVAHRQRFALHRRVQVFARLGVVPGALPLAHVLEERAAPASETLRILQPLVADKDGDVLAYAREVFGRFSPAALPANYAMLTGFSHIFGAAYGYAAGYYSYQWSEMLQADAFGRFRDGGILSREVGDQFRQQILSRGDTDDAAALVRTFLGRDPDVTALLTRLGIAA